MNTYTIVLADNTKLNGFKNLDYAGNDAYGKETYEGSNVFPVEDIHFTCDLKEIVLENK